jgi:hypothetical protein
MVRERRGVSWGTLAAIMVAGALLAGAVLAMTALEPRVEKAREFNDAFAGATTVVVDADSTTVHIGVSPDGRPTVHARLRWNTAREPLYTARLDGTTLTVKMGRCGLRIFSMFCESTMAMTVPANVELRVASDSGDVRVSGVQGPTHLDADSGNVELTGLGGPLTVSLDSGRLDGVALTSPSVDAQLDSGDVDLRFVSAPARIDAHTDSGRVSIAVPAGSGPYGVETHTDSGVTRVDVSRASAANRTITADTDSGDITISYLSV